MYDVIIAGASFAGLAVASQLRGYRVLLLDRKLIGAGQTSACGTIARLMEYWELSDSILQRHTGLKLHTPAGEVRFLSPYPWCTFDYDLFCRTLFERSGAEFRQETVQKVVGNKVLTSRGAYAARFIVDATGWKAALASQIDRRHASARAGLNLGLESTHPFNEKDTYDRTLLHFWYDPAVLQNGIGWAFPRGEEVSLGVGSYGRALGLRPALARMTGEAGKATKGPHGSFFPYRLQDPTAGELFVVGDAAGMCLGLTGEGIRPAMYFGEACGRIIRRGLDHGQDRAVCLGEYSKFVRSHRVFFAVFTKAQQILTRLPPWAIGLLANFVSVGWILRRVFDRYWGLTRAWDDKPSALSGFTLGTPHQSNSVEFELAGMFNSIEGNASEMEPHEPSVHASSWLPPTGSPIERRDRSV
jgi:flavin-dependent dehydrogenase